jgi:hypothetical protein
VRGAPFELEVGTRHARPDKRTLPAASGPNELFSLSVIASMAHSTFKSRAATQDSVAFGYPLKIRGNNPSAEEPTVLSLSNPAADVADLRSRSAANGLMGRDSQQWAVCPNATEPGSSKPSVIPF